MTSNDTFMAFDKAPPGLCEHVKGSVSCRVEAQSRWPLIRRMCAAQAPPLFQERRQKQIADADAALAAGRSHREIGVLVSRTTRTIKGWIQMGLIGKERAC